MNEPSHDALTDHEYDGIREYDNPTPGWWHALFLITVVFSVVYFVYFHISPSSGTIQEAYETAVADDLRRQFAAIGELTADEATILRFMHDEKWMTVGKLVYAANCKSCHLADGEGQVGPNMTDEHYKNVKNLEDVASVITNGAANGAMPAWKTRLHPNEVVLVAAYVASLRGGNRPGKAPEGDPIAPWPAYEPPAVPDPETTAPGGG